MAAARCRHTISRLDWLDDSIENMEAVKNATEEVIEGVLRNNRGTVRTSASKDVSNAMD